MEAFPLLSPPLSGKYRVESLPGAEGKVWWAEDIETG